MRITLLRHGNRASELKGYVQAKDMGVIVPVIRRIRSRGHAPREIIEAIQGDHMVVCSRLTRSTDSAKAPGFSLVHIKEVLFRETAMPYFANGTIPPPAVGWVVFLRVAWRFGYSRNGESLADARSRAGQAGERLVQLAVERQSVLHIGHGLKNHFIARELIKFGWLGPSNPGRKYLAYGIYENSSS